MSTENKPLTAEEMLKSARSGVAVVGGLREAVVSLSQVEAILRIQAHQSAEKDARIKELEEDNGHLTMRNQEAWGAEDEMRRNWYKAVIELEAANKERDSIKGTVTKSWVALTFERNEHKKVRDQRDALKKQLETAVGILRDVEPFIKEARKGLYAKRDDVSHFLASQQTTEQDVKYISCPNCIAKGKDPSGMTIDGIYLECSTCDGSGQIVKPPTNETTEKEAGESLEECHI